MLATERDTFSGAMDGDAWRVVVIARVTADLVVLLHFAFILFVVLGGMLVLKWRKAALAHLPCMLWGALIEFGGWICPLTPLEQRLRETAGGEGYSGGFVEHYVIPLVYPEALTRGVQIGFGVAILAVNLFVYGVVVIGRPRAGRGGANRGAARP
jgi:hypothetical protein